MPAPSADLTVTARDGTVLSVQRVGEGPAIVLLHGLTATRRYVVMGSRLLERSGHTVISYDARGHGRSAPAAGGYDYSELADDLEDVLDALLVERTALAGSSMGAHTIVRFALRHPERVTALGLITPAFTPESHETFEGWDALARGLRTAGVDGFVEAYDFSRLPVGWRATVEKVTRQRLAAHEHPQAVADALEAVPRSRPFEAMAELGSLHAPTLIVADRDEADPGHPLEVGERYAAAIPGARLLVEQEGSSPIAWQGGQLSRALLDLIDP